MLDPLISKSDCLSPGEVNLIVKIDKKEAFASQENACADITSRLTAPSSPG